MASHDQDRIHDLERENEHLRIAVSELTLLNELATETSGMSDVEEILQRIIRSSMKAVQAEQGVITLIDDQKENELRTLVRTNLRSNADNQFRPNDHLTGWMQVNKRPILINDVHSDQRFPHSRWDESIRSILSVPLITRGSLIGILTLYNKLSPDGFQSNDQRLLIIIASQSAQIVANARLNEDRTRIIRLFGQHTSPVVVAQLLSTDTEMDGTRKKVCVMFLDIRGFTKFSERRMPEEVVAYLNALFEITIAAVSEFGGIVHQLLGDGFMAIFGAPISQENDSRSAVLASLAAVERVEKECKTGNLPDTRLGIGLHTGEVVAGSVGTAIHKEYKVTGDVVNLAARIEKMNKVFDSHLLISEEVYADLDPSEFAADVIGSVDVPGRDNAVSLYRLA